MKVSPSHKSLLIIVVLLLTFNVELMQMIRYWSVFDQSYSHGFLLAGYSGYLMVVASKSLKKSSPSYLAAFLLVACLLVWVAARLLFVEVAAEAMWPITTLAALAAWLGWMNMWRMFIPVSLLLLTVSIWDHIGYSLQIITVFFDQFLLGAAGIEFEVDGIYVILPGKGTFAVAFGCSGLRYLLISLALAMIMAQQWLKTLSAKVKIIIAGIVLGMASNWLRVAIIIYIGDVTNMQSPLINDHETFGWILFAVMMIPLLYFGNRLEHQEVLKQSDSGATLEQTASESSLEKLPAKETIGARPIVLVLSLLLLSFSLWKITAVENTTTVQRSIAIAPAGWSVLAHPLGDVAGSFFNKPDILWRSSLFRGDGQQVQRLDGVIYQYHQQRTGRELIQSGNRFYDPALYRLQHRSELQDGWLLTQLQDRRTGGRLWQLSTYMFAGRNTSGAISAKLMLLKQPLQQNKNAAAVVWQFACESCAEDQSLLLNLTATAREIFSHSEVSGL